MPSRLIDELQRRYAAETGAGRLLGVVLHGSAVSQRQDALSDLDLLLITDQAGPAFHDLWHIDQTACDLHITSLPELLRAANRDVASNNNFALRAFGTGVLLFEADASIAGHQSLSKTRWQAGPGQPHAGEVYGIREAARQTDLFLAKCLTRAVSDPTWREIQFARSGTFLGQLTDSYCRLNRLWSNAFWILRHENDTAYQPVVAAIRQFLLPDPDQKTETLRALCGTVISMADERLRKDKPVRPS